MSSDRKRFRRRNTIVCSIADSSQRLSTMAGRLPREHALPIGTVLKAVSAGYDLSEG